MTRAQLLGLVWPWRSRMILVAGLMLVESLTMLAVPWFGGQLAGRLVVGGNESAPATGLVVVVLVLLTTVAGLRALALAAQEAQAKALGLAEMHLQLLPAIKSFTREGPASRRYGEAIARSRDIQLKEIRIYAVLNPMVQLVASVAAVLLVVLAGRGSGEMSAADLVAFLLYAALLTRPVSGLADVYGQIQTLKGTLARLGRVLNTAPEREAPDACALTRTVLYQFIPFLLVGFHGNLSYPIKTAGCLRETPY